ncbi:MAG: hypothetical protein IPJ65_03995 [Archangiaceae bacterium]|nr:hypothetical protein [Archangiaceae bacterium]
MTGLLFAVWLAAVDGGTAAPAPTPGPPKATLSKEDAELLQHLEVLEAYDEAKDLELLEELSAER